MKKVLIVLLFLVVIGIGVYIRSQAKSNNGFPSLDPNVPSQANNVTQNKTERISIVAQNLDTPWGIAFLPARNASSTADAGGEILVTERKGTVQRIDENGQTTLIATIQNAKEGGEGGLLGITIHPNFEQNKYVYLYYTYRSNESGTLNRVVRMKYEDGKLTNEEIVLDRIPGASNHNGGRIKFGPDGNLYVGTGDAQNESSSQDTTSLAGKILRVTEAGKPVVGNSFGSEVYSYGHRNVQGLAWDQDGNLWATEHGRSGVQSGLDELNLIQGGKNYGWPTIQGDQKQNGMETPIRHSGATNTWAPGGAAYSNRSIYFVGLRGQALYKATISGSTVTNFKEYLKGEYGRLRDIVVGPDNMLYVTTSNKDGRGSAKNGDDKILRVNPDLL